MSSYGDWFAASGLRSKSANLLKTLELVSHLPGNRVKVIGRARANNGKRVDGKRADNGKRADGKRANGKRANNGKRADNGKVDRCGDDENGEDGHGNNSELGEHFGGSRSELLVKEWQWLAWDARASEVARLQTVMMFNECQTLFYGAGSRTWVTYYHAKMPSSYVTSSTFSPN